MAALNDWRDSDAETAPRRYALPLLVAVLVLVVLLFDLSFFKKGEYRAPVFDAVHYFEKADYLLMLAGNRLPWLVAMSDNPAFARSPHITDNDFDLVARYLSGQGPGYPVFLSLVELTLGRDYTDGRLAQALLHVACLLLVVAITRRVAGRGAAALAGIAFAAYLPGGYMASQFLAENLCHLLILLSVYLALRWIDPDEPHGAICAMGLGLALVWLALSRPVYLHFSWVFALAVLMVAVYNRRGRRASAWLPSVLMLAVALMGPYLAWQAQVSKAYDAERFIWSPSQIRSLAPSLWESYDLNNNGWVKPAAFLGPRGRALESVPLKTSVTEHPLQSVLLRVEKFFRLWRAPATAYNNPYGLPGPVTNGLHLLLVVGAVGGLVLMRRFQPLVVVGLPVLFTAAAYTAYFSEERRFIFPVMGLAVVLCAVAVVGIWRRYQQAGLVAYGQRVPGATWGWLAVSAASALALYAPGTVLVPWLPASPMHGLAVLLFAVSLGQLSWRLARWLIPQGWGRMVTIALFWSVLVLPPVVHHSVYRDWQSWAVSLDEPGMQVLQRFTLPKNLTWNQVVAATVQIDLLDKDGHLDGIEVTANGSRLTDPISPANMPPPFRFAAENLSPLSRGVDFNRVAVVPGMRYWLSYWINPKALADAVPLEVRISVSDGADGNGDTWLYGDLALGDSGTYLGPRPWLSPLLHEKGVRNLGYSGRNSMWRYQAYGDMRIHGNMRLAGTATSHYQTADMVGPQSKDLSDAVLIQDGGYRVRLQVITADGRELIL
jgi:hypothetical protein